MSKPFTAEDAEKGFNLRVKSKNYFDVETLATVRLSDSTELVEVSRRILRAFTVRADLPL
jgi:hypothetical protein